MLHLKGLRSRGPFQFPIAAVVEIAIGLLCLVVFAVHPSAQWVEAHFINGYYPGLQSGLARASAAVPFPLGDCVVLAGIAALVVRAVYWARAAGSRRLRLARSALETAATLALYAIWFYAAWGWCYDRGPLVERVNFNPHRVALRVVMSLQREAVARLNHLAPLAHRARHDPDLRPVANDVQTIANRLGDPPDFFFGDPKESLIDWYLSATGIAGYVNPYSAEAIEASDVLWFERPDFTAHEWSHLAGFAREDEANYIAVVACLRSSDPVVQYSGWLQLFLYLPGQKLNRTTFVKEVWADFAAMRARNRSHVNLGLSTLQWRFYNNYLQANRVKNGTVSYSQFVTLLIAVRRGADGLPVARPVASSAQDTTR